MIFQVLPDLDEVWLRRFRAAEERGERNAALGQIFADAQFQLEMWVIENTHPQDHIQLSMRSHSLSLEIRSVMSIVETFSWRAFFFSNSRSFKLKRGFRF